MYKFVIQNIQAISRAEITVKDNSITEFVGDNSNGKSILSKIIQYLTSGDIYQKDVRDALIKDDCDSGAFLIEHNNMQLAVALRSPINLCFAVFCPDMSKPKDTIKRYFNEKGIDEFLYQMGFRTYAKGEICLQLAPTFGAIPFVTTSGQTNNEIVQDITTDRVAEEFLDTYAKITYPVLKNRVATLRGRIEENDRALMAMNKYDWRAYGEIAEKMHNLYEDIKHYQYYVPDFINLLPKVDIVPIKPYEPMFIKIPEFGPIKEPPVDLSAELDNLLAVLNGVCPTCKRPLIEKVGD